MTRGLHCSPIIPAFSSRSIPWYDFILVASIGSSLSAAPGQVTGQASSQGARSCARWHRTSLMSSPAQRKTALGPGDLGNDQHVILLLSQTNPGRTDATLSPVDLVCSAG